ncbi:hypothetical protein FHW96_000243 [Novosphingobium sp. SG751A]|uniref:hypothetical protein n=1 Tax=Novosphingobium sp. SG751A TaxID=2587000 RepID=UPI001557E445|nr:hypothetical protein [Novosphingobium sp. SG751A]NOW44116.1 hypothetical protein [Novosphingobium sp. SG751A]
MMFAIGRPGEMPRCWIEARRREQAEAQLLPDEVLSDDVAMGEDGRPVPAALPAN